MTAVANAFDELQERLGEALHANRPGSGIDHVMVVLPSFSLATAAHFIVSGTPLAWPRTDMS